jgi:transposase
VFNSKDITSTAKGRDRKSDPMDASKIAVELETGRLVPIYIPDSEHFHFRSLCRSYYQSVQISTRSKCRITGIINFYGIEMPKHSSKWPKLFINELYEMPLDDGPQKLTLIFVRMI